MLDVDCVVFSFSQFCRTFTASSSAFSWLPNTPASSYICAGKRVAIRVDSADPIRIHSDHLGGMTSEMVDGVFSQEE